MTDERPPRRPLPPMRDDEIVEIPPTGVSGRYDPPRPREPFTRLVQTPAETTREVLALQRKMALQLDGFGQLVNRRFELFHEELALQGAKLTELITLVKTDHAPRLEKVEKTAAEKAKAAGAIAARYGAWGSLALFVGGAALRALAKIYPEYGSLIESIVSGLGVP